jgi:tetratricopeptide (TPR) repeat protein
MAASFNQLGLVAHAQADHDQAEQFLSQALELSRELEDRYSIAAALDGLGLVNMAQGRYDEAQSLLRESMALWREIGEQGNLAQTLTHIGTALLKAGDKANARSYFLDALSMAREMQTLPVLLDALVGEAEIQALDGATESAVGILIAVSQNPSSSLATKLRAERLRSDLIPGMSTQRVKTIRARINHQAIDLLVKDILSITDVSFLVALAILGAT